MIVTTQMIQVIALITAMITFVAVIIWRVLLNRRYILVHWAMFVAMFLGAIVIWWFYNEVENTTQIGGDVLDLIIFSRLLFIFILVSTSLMAVGSIVYWYFNERGKS